MPNNQNATSSRSKQGTNKNKLSSDETFAQSAVLKLIADYVEPHNNKISDHKLISSLDKYYKINFPSQTSTEKSLNSPIKRLLAYWEPATDVPVLNVTVTYSVPQATIPWAYEL